MFLSILAGIMIAIGGVIYLSIGGAVGATLFAVGLLTILCLRLELFTGKAGLYATKEVRFGKLLEIWCGNFIGTWIVSLYLLATPKGEILREAAKSIVDVRVANGFVVNVIYGIFCGILMYAAVKCWSIGGNPLYAIFPVAVFILAGFNHCVADMFYVHIGFRYLSDYLVLIPTTIGNFIGCCLIPCGINYSSSRTSAL